MVSFQSIEFENSTKKRKWEDHHQQGLRVEELLNKPAAVKAKITNYGSFDTELKLETPLPLEWQRCLDIKSGEVHYYNVMTQKRTSSDPRTLSNGRDPPINPNNISLDLELHLPCGNSLRTSSFVGNNNSGSSSLEINKNKNLGGGLTRSPSWLASEGDQREMITAVCKKCHMLVMMCKSSPTCPNCKFVHPPDQNPLSLFKQSLTLLC